MASPSWIQVHPTSLPQSGDYQSKLTLMSESLRNDGRIWVPLKQDEKRAPNDIPENERDYYLERRYPAFGNLAQEIFHPALQKKELMPDLELVL